MATTVERQTLRITDVTDVQVTEIVAAEGGGYTRAVRFFGPGGNAQLPVLEIIVVGATREDISVTTPEIDF